MAVITTTCSGCRADLRLYPAEGRVRADVAANGLRGSKHVPAHTVSNDMWGDDDLYEWECPACGHSDSFDPNA